MGRSGTAALALADAKGFQAVGIDEGYPSAPEGGWGSPERISVETRFRGDALPDADLAVASPGLKPNSRLIRLAERLGAPIVDELDFAASHAEAPMVAVTGTNGKTTVATLAAEILGKGASAAGNIGRPLSDAVLDTSISAIVVEASSFQLRRSPSFAPRAAALLNIEQDHLDWHPSMEDYSDAKLGIFANNAEPRRAIVNLDLLPLFERGYPERERPVTFSAKDPAADIHIDSAGRLASRTLPLPPVHLPIGEIRREHDIENLMAAAALAAAILKPAELAEKLEPAARSFKRPEHRLRSVAEIGGVEFIDDSKATNPAAMAAALRSIEAPVNLVAGGLGKGLDFKEILPLGGRIKKAFLYGEARGEIERQWRGGIETEYFDTFEDATLAAAEHAEPGDAVLLSPGCASMDLFENYKERGLAFQRIVGKLESY